VARVTAVPLALTVKKTDISHNADPVLQAALLSEERRRLTVKYETSALLLGTTREGILKEHRESRVNERAMEMRDARP